MSEALEQAAPAKTGFFAVDRRIWAKLCVPGMMNEAVAYIVQARGTGRDNRTTTWSVESIERYTGISRHRAAVAVKNLQAKGVTRLLRGGTKPKYDLVPFSELPGADPRPALSGPESLAVDWVRRGIGLGRNDQRHARNAAKKGWLLEHQGEFAIAPVPEIKPDLIWLPNGLVDGAAGETPPLELVRQTQDPMTLRLIIDMYHAQNLREDGGVSRRFIWKKFDRVKIGEHAQFTVWGFQGGSVWVSWENDLTLPHRREKLTKEEIAAGENPGVDFFRRMTRLRDLGLFEWAPHLVESAEDSGEIIHPLHMGGSDSIEDRLGRAAHEAGKALITEGQYDWAVEKGIHQLVPVPRHIANVQMIGIARLRYRPHTRMTTAWWADLKANADIRRNSGLPNYACSGVDCSIKEVSRWDQGGFKERTSTPFRLLAPLGDGARYARMRIQEVRSMIDPDRYWAASGLLAGNSPSPPPETKPTTSSVTAQQIDGGCLLYRLPARRRRDTDTDGPCSA